ncbi:MAG TPA: efflux transporter outer membrane subunit [Pirellulales bacterium]|jgi:NodT family efflux transporter outer membrane factor (OMF) lipoprotein|nr:efflux transporter outer membrane subunit [Pirellulales bacterium]
MNPFVRTSNGKHGSRILAIAIACSLLLALPGCAIPKLRHSKPGPVLPQDFNGSTSAENSAQVPTNEFFNDPQLISLFEQAVVGNQQLRILAQNIEIANNEVLRRRGMYLPFLSMGAGASLNKYSYNTLEGADNLQNIPLNAPSFPTPLPDFMGTVDLSWQVDIWRQLRYARNSAALRYLGTKDGWNFVVTRLVAEIAENYYQLMALDKRIENLNTIIALQENSLEVAKSRKEFARDTELGVQRFQAEVRKNQSQKLIVNQEIIQTENRINFLCGRYPQRVDRATLPSTSDFIDLNLHALNVGVPAQILRNRPDIRQAERELEAAGLDVNVARANFYPKLIISAGVGYEAFNPQYLFLTPESLIYSVAGGLVAPLVNKKAIQADYMNANARQLQAIYDYQRTTLTAFTEVVNRVTKVQNYSNSIEIKKQQLTSLETAVNVASNLFQNARPGIDYMDVLFAQRDLLDARLVTIDTKQEQLAAIVDTYQALGGGQLNLPDQPLQTIGKRPPTQPLPPFGPRPPVKALPAVGSVPVAQAPPAFEAPPPAGPLVPADQVPAFQPPPPAAPAEGIPAPQPGPVIQGPVPVPAPVIQGPVPVPLPVIQGPAPRPGPVIQGPVQVPAPVIQGPVQVPAPVIQGPVQVPAPVIQGPVQAPSPVIQAPPPVPEPPPVPVDGAR